MSTIETPFPNPFTEGPLKDSKYQWLGGKWGQFGWTWRTWRPSDRGLDTFKGVQGRKQVPEDEALNGYLTSRRGTTIFRDASQVDKDPFDMQDYVFNVSGRKPELRSYLVELDFTDQQMDLVGRSFTHTPENDAVYRSRESKLYELLRGPNGSAIAAKLAELSKFGWNDDVTPTPFDVVPFSDYWKPEMYWDDIHSFGGAGATEPSVISYFVDRGYSDEFITRAMNYFYSRPASEWNFEQGWQGRAVSDTLDPRIYGEYPATLNPPGWIDTKIEGWWHVNESNGEFEPGFRSIFELDPQTFRVGSVLGAGFKATDPFGRVGTLTFGQRKFQFIIPQPVLDKFSPREKYKFFLEWGREFLLYFGVAHPPSELPQPFNHKDFIIAQLGQSSWDIRSKILEEYVLYMKSKNLSIYPVSIPDWQDRPREIIVRPFPSPYVGYGNKDKFTARLIAWMMAYAPFLTDFEFQYFWNITGLRMRNSVALQADTDNMLGKLTDLRARNESAIYEVKE